MLYNLKIALRNFRRNGIYSIINLVGLALSLTAVILIMLWVSDEWSFDKFHHRNGDIRQINMRIDNNSCWNITCAPLAFTALREIPEIENSCRYVSFWTLDILKNVEEGREERFVVEFTNGMVDSTFFLLFDFQLLEGDRQRMLVDPHSIVLSSSIAQKLFGTESPLGKVLLDNNLQSYFVTGVMADMPHNSSIRCDVLLPMTLYEETFPDELTSWNRLDFRTWFLLRPHTDPVVVAQKLTELFYEHSDQMDETMGEVCWLQPFKEVNFHDANGSLNAKALSCRLFLTIAGVIILVACANYINISTARAARRNREVSVKNILGARKGYLFVQFLHESILLFFLSLLVATFLLPALFPIFNRIAGKGLVFTFFSLQTLVVYGATFLIVVLFSGIYPAYNLVMNKPLQGIRNKFGNAGLRRVLVVGQFVVATVLIMVTITTRLQLEYLQKKNPGYAREHVFYVKTSHNIQAHYDAFKSELLQNPAIIGVTSMSMPLKMVTSTYGITVDGIDTHNQATILLSTDKDFISTMEVPLVAGENFTGTFADREAVLLNETAVKTMGMKDPVGKRCRVVGVDQTIIGVVHDFHFKDLHTPIEPLVIEAGFWNWRNYLYVRTSAYNAPQAVAAVEKGWKAYESDLPFSVTFMDDEFASMYKTDLQAGVLFRYFAIIAIFISCLGLFGLVTYTAETRTKEIGIRKVLGSSVASVVNMLSKEFLILVGIALLIAFPLGYYWLSNLLQDFAYRIQIGWWIFALAGVITLVLTLITVGGQAMRAATENPVKSIKTE